jgi:hypothetical protein
VTFLPASPQALARRRRIDCIASYMVGRHSPIIAKATSRQNGGNRCPNCLEMAILVAGLQGIVAAWAGVQDAIRSAAVRIIESVNLDDA